jgi:hypothetical protein
MAVNWDCRVSWINIGRRRFGHERRRQSLSVRVVTDEVGEMIRHCTVQ